MNKVCEICGREFEAKRADARYCSGTCQKQAKRAGNPVRDKLSRTESVTNVRDKSDVVRDNKADVRDNKFYDNLTGPQAQKLLAEECERDHSISPVQSDGFAITGARIRARVPRPISGPWVVSTTPEQEAALLAKYPNLSAIRKALMNQYTPPPDPDKEAQRKARVAQLSGWEGVSAVRGEVVA